MEGDVVIMIHGKMITLSGKVRTYTDAALFRLQEKITRATEQAQVIGALCPEVTVNIKVHAMLVPEN